MPDLFCVGCDVKIIGTHRLRHHGRSGFPDQGLRHYRKEKVPKIGDLGTKLWGETERSVAANLLREGRSEVAS